MKYFTYWRQWRIIESLLKLLAKSMTDNPNRFTIEEWKAVDRALRSCPFISDIDRVWVRWCYVGEKCKWITDKEMIIKNGRYQYDVKDIKDL